MTQSSSSKSSWPYVAAAICILLGPIGAVWSFYSAVVTFAGAIVQVVVPGQADLNLEKAGTYTVYVETQSVKDGKSYRSPDTLPDLHCRVIPAAGGEAPALYEPEHLSTYKIEGRSAHSLLAFDVKQPGMHRFACGYDAQPAKAEAVLAIAPAAGPNYTLVFRALGMTFSSFAVGIGFIVFGYRRNKRAQGAPPAYGATA